MERVALDDVEPDAVADGAERRALAEPLGTTGVAINRYRLEPGEALPGGLHAHGDQEEVFLVLDGEATFETYGLRGGAEHVVDGEVTVRAGEAIRFAPGEFQSGRNGSNVDLVVLAIGAPRNGEDVRLPAACPDCGHGNLRLDTDGSGVAFVCPDCGGERVPAPCPDCGGDDLHISLGDGGEPVVVCRDCDAEFSEPPLRD